MVIPTYNRLSYLKECIDSVRAQSFAPVEVIVVDDGSSDGTREWVLQQQDVALLVQKNAGPGAARNYGAENAMGDYIAFLDSDDVWFPWTLACFAQVISEQSVLSVVFASFQDFSDRSVLLTETQELPLHYVQHPDYLSTAGLGFFAGAGMMVIDRRLYDEVGGFVEDRLNAEDHDLVLRLSDAPGFVQVVEPILIGHRLHGANEMSSSAKNIGGLNRLLARERSGAYPGGDGRKPARLQIISQHARPQILALARDGHGLEAARLFASTLGMHLRLGRFRFLALSVISIVIGLFRPKVQTSA